MLSDAGDEDNFYRLIYNLTEGTMFNISNNSHDFLKMFQVESPDLDKEDFVPFNCSTSIPHPPAPATTVHKLTPYDVNVVAAMGDSITAAFGALSFTLVDLFVEFRGISWSIGGDSTLKKHITLPNILKRFNPTVKGYASGIAPPLIAVPWEHLNVAVSGSTAYDLLDQAKELVARLERNKAYDMEKDWKVLTIFIGGNDLCACCRKYKDHMEKYKPANYIKKMTEVLDYLSENVPRMLVNVVDAPDVTLLEEMKSLKCTTTHYLECKCGTVLGEEARKYTYKTMQEYHRLLKELVVDSGRYDSKDDFAVVLQPFIDATKPPILKSGKVDPTYWAPDCFHFSGKSHSAAAHGLWNNMLQPVGHKDKRWKVAEPYTCPTEKHPYFYTNVNSKYDETHW